MQRAVPRTSFRVVETKSYRRLQATKNVVQATGLASLDERPGNAVFVPLVRGELTSERIACTLLGLGRERPGGGERPEHQPKARLDVRTCNAHVVSASTVRAPGDPHVAPKHWTPKHLSGVDFSQVEVRGIFRRGRSRRVEPPPEFSDCAETFEERAPWHTFVQDKADCQVSGGRDCDQIWRPRVAALRLAPKHSVVYFITHPPAAGSP